MSEEMHYAACGPSCKEFLAHVIHVWSHMLEENLVAGTKVVETRLAVGCVEEAQTGTFAVTGLEPGALSALAGERFLLHPAEAVLLRAVEHLRQSVRAYVT